MSDRLSILVHEVRSPVAALAAVAQAARESHEFPSGRRELVRLAIGACSAIERIVTDIAVASVRATAVDTSDLVRGAVAAHAVAGTEIEGRVAPDLPWIHGDAVRLRQALDNLISNAVVHGRGGRVVVTATRVDATVSISVADSGAGIPSEDLERIFEPGVRLGDTGPGSGLGLAITRQIVEAHGGALGVESSPTGSVFTITVPQSET